MAILQTMLLERKSEDELLWQEWANFVPTRFILLSAQGMEPELAADLADDGLPVSEPVDVAEDGNPVAIEWIGMYEAAA